MIDESTLNNLSEASGVYFFRDGENRIIYIGKARNIRDRVKSYFREGSRDAKTEHLIKNIDHVDVLLTENEKEAFLLENNLIKEHTPKYNVNLRDDKTYISLKVSLQHPFPGIYVTREIKNDGALYLGPYPHARDVKEVLKLVQSIYPIRKCKDSVFNKRKRPCILFEIGTCIGPCSGKLDETEYRRVVDEMVDFLSGKNERLLRDLKKRIEEAGAAWKFDEARLLKERYLAIKDMVEKQNVHEHFGKNRDVWAFTSGDDGLKSVVLCFRKGVLIGKRSFHNRTGAMPLNEAISSFVFQYYDTRAIPDEIILSESMTDQPFLEKHLKDKKKGPVKIYGPQTKPGKEMMGLAIENLHEPVPVLLDEAFKHALHLRKNPIRIEAYDISHTHGKNPSGVMVVFEEFKMTKKAYRVFHIRGEATMDDVAMMNEVLKRRLTDEKITPLPDLVIIDGGKGHLSAALKVLRDLDMSIDSISIAKDPRRKNMEDIIYLPMRKNPLPLPKSSPVLKEIVKMRDEAHRFAITSHKRWKRKEDLASKG
jgi:excinuclease ABC subunit C